MCLSSQDQAQLDVGWQEKLKNRILHEVQPGALTLTKPEVPTVSPARLEAPRGLCSYDASFPLLRMCRLMLAPCLSNEDHTEESSNAY